MNKKFAPCPVAPDDELYRLGKFVFNITRMLDFIERNQDRFSVEDISVGDLYGAPFSQIDESRLSMVDVLKPVIIAEVTPGQFTLIDGNHRMEKARRLGLKTLKAYRLHILDHISFLTTKEAYERYMQYFDRKNTDSQR